MTMQHTSRRRPVTALSAAAALLLSLAACAQPSGDGAAKPPYPTHVHALALKPGTMDVLVASHEGIYEVEGSELRPTGANIDLMGFTIDGDGVYLASGHPGPGVDLPDPVGLISSADGEDWTRESLAGESDFHALTVASGGIIGFDGTLRLSSDARSWTDAPAQFTPHSLAASPSGPLVLATTEDGPLVSSDSGLTWSPLPNAPVIMLAAVTESRLVGVLPDGGIRISTDGGQSWDPAGSVSGYPVAATAAETEDGLQIWVMTDAGLERSTDGGQTFSLAVVQPAEAP